MVQQTENQTNQISLGLYLGFFGGLLGCAYFVVRPFFDWNEGYFAVAEIFFGAIFMIILFGGVIALVIYYIKLLEFYSWAEIIIFWGIVLFCVYVYGFFALLAIKPAYYIITEPKIITTTSDYYLKSYEEPKRYGVYSYYLYFDNDNCVKINKETYHRLNLNKYNLTITYKPKAEILYELQISPKE